MNIAHEMPSIELPPAKSLGPYVFQDGTRGREYDIGPYQVCVRWDWLGAEKGQTGTFALLQICRSDGGSVFDWRDLQQIKSRILSPEWEGVEVFPAEFRLKDPSNARYLWCSNRILPFGLPGGRVVIDAPLAMAPQRPFGKRVNP